MKVASVLLGLAVAAFCSTEAMAQIYYPQGTGSVYGYRYPAPIYGPYGFYYHPSTAAEGYGYGMGAVIRAMGERNLNNSEAAKNYQQAYSQQLDNRLKATETYFAMRRINEAYQQEKRDAERQRVLSSEGMVREASHHLYAERLTAVELDPVTGLIQWPEVLMRDEYAVYRMELDSLFRVWAEMGEPDSSTLIRISVVTDAFLETLKEDIHTYHPNDYLDGKKFVARLAYSSRFSTA